MKRNLGDYERLLHIFEAIGNINSFLESMDYDEFTGSKLHRAAVERQLEIIGEATAALSDELKSRYPDIEWRLIKQFRNVIVHEYFGVSIQILWGVVKKDLPVLKPRIEQILSELAE